MLCGLAALVPCMLELSTTAVYLVNSTDITVSPIDKSTDYGGNGTRVSHQLSAARYSWTRYLLNGNT